MQPKTNKIEAVAVTDFCSGDTLLAVKAPGFLEWGGGVKKFWAGVNFFAGGEIFFRENPDFTKKLIIFKEKSKKNTKNFSILGGSRDEAPEKMRNFRKT